MFVRTRAEAGGQMLGVGLAAVLLVALVGPASVFGQTGSPYWQVCQRTCSRQNPPFVGECMSACLICAWGDCNCYNAADKPACKANIAHQCNNTYRKYQPQHGGQDIKFPMNTKPHDGYCNADQVPATLECTGFITGLPGGRGDICDNVVHKIDCDPSKPGYGCVNVQVCKNAVSGLLVTGCRCWDRNDIGGYPDKDKPCR